MTTTKSKKTKTEAPDFPVARYVFKPERCTSHKFALDLDGKTDFTRNDVSDDSRCTNCGLYFSTWVWYSEKVSKAYLDGIDNEAGQTLIYVANQVGDLKDAATKNWGELLLDKLRERRKKQNVRRLQLLDRSDS
jgi:hypothetical protein